MNKQTIPQEVIESLNLFGLNDKVNSWDDIIRWIEDKENIALELVLDPQKKWIWRLTPIDDDSKLNEQIISDRLHDNRYSAINHAITETITYLKSFVVSKV